MLHSEECMVPIAGFDPTETPMGIGMWSGELRKLSARCGIRPKRRRLNSAFADGASNGIRTRTVCLEGRNATIEHHTRIMPGFALCTLWSRTTKFEDLHLAAPGWLLPFTKAG